LTRQSLVLYVSKK